MKRALLSVSDKTGIVHLAQELIQLDYEILSTGGTKKLLDEYRIPSLAVEDVTGFPEMLEGRVKTLHPAVHGGILYKRSEAQHIQVLEQHGIQSIDLLCVNLYPFQQTICKPGITLEEAIENIDIGGPAMLRSAAKNYADVIVISSPLDYEEVLSRLHDQHCDLAFRQQLALKVFQHTASYDAVIAGYLASLNHETFPERLILPFRKQKELRYGENPHQPACFYRSEEETPNSLIQAHQLHGKELSYNNIRDADAAMQILAEFDQPTAVAVKHMNPCGVGIGEHIDQAFDRAYAADSLSIFGGIVVFNRAIEAETAEKLSRIFLEIVIAPAFSQKALELLTCKKDLRLLELSVQQSSSRLEQTAVTGGVLLQEKDLTEAESQWQVVSQTTPSASQQQALRMLWKVVKHVKSNAIVVGNEQQTFGIGAGQMNRVGAAKIALEQAGSLSMGACMASDAFLPMKDTVEVAAKAGIRAIIQPGGSIRDQESIDSANEHGITMIFTGCRHFKH